ncbi:MAG: hypothetical protein PARBA_00305 [Parabacteroides sp.]
MKVIKKKISVLGVKYNSKWEWFDINFGSVVFRLLQGQIMIDETPYSDEHLVPIKNIVVNEKYFSFDSFYKNQDTHFEVHYSSFNIAMLIAKYIKCINEYGVIFNNEYDSFDFLQKESELYISLGNELTGKRIVVCYNDYRNYFTLVYPKPGKEFLIDNCTYENNTIYVKCKGHNLWDENDLTTDYIYQWKINFDSKSGNILDILLHFGFEKISNICNQHLSDNKNDDNKPG